MNNKKAAVLVDYLSRYMEFVGTEAQQGSSGNALKFYDKVVTKFGKGIILRAGTRQISMVNLVNNYEIGN